MTKRQSVNIQEVKDRLHQVNVELSYVSLDIEALNTHSKSNAIPEAVQRALDFECDRLATKETELKDIQSNLQQTLSNH